MGKINNNQEGEKAVHGGDRKSTDAKSSSLNANLIDSSKTCDRIAEENGVSRASVLRASHYTRGIDIADNRSPGIKQKVLRLAGSLLEQRGRTAVTCRGGGPSILLTQDRSVAQKPHWGFHCCATAAFCFPKKQKIRTLLLLRKGSDFHYLVRVVIQHFLKTIVVQFDFEVVG